MGPYLIPILLIGIWLLNSAIFSMFSGWMSLADTFRASERPDGEQLWGQVKQIGFIPQNRVTHMIVSPSGLYLYQSILFRFLHPPILIPWSEVQYVGPVELFWGSTYQFDLASIARIRVTQAAYEAIGKYLK